MLHAARVGDPVAPEAPGKFGLSSQPAQTAAIEINPAARLSAAGVAHQVDDAPQGVTAVERRTRTAHHFHPLGAHQEEVLQERRGVALRGGCVTEAQAVHGDGGILRAQSARENSGQGARSSHLLHAQAGHGLQSLPERCFHARPNLVGMQHVHRPGYLCRWTRQSGGRHDHLGPHLADFQPDLHVDLPVPNGHRARRLVKTIRRSFQPVVARRHLRKRETSVPIGGGNAPAGSRAGQQRHHRARQRRAGRVGEDSLNVLSGFARKRARQKKAGEQPAE